MEGTERLGDANGDVRPAASSASPSRNVTTIGSTVPSKEKSMSQPKPSAAVTAAEPSISVKSESPFKLKMKLSAVPLDKGGIPRKAKGQNRQKFALPTRANAPSAAAAAAKADADYFATKNRTSTRMPKRKLSSYAEKEEDDLGDTDSEDSAGDYSGSGVKMAPAASKRAQRKVAKRSEDDYIDEINEEEFLLPPEEIDPSKDIVDLNQVEAPPPGTLSSLWYSRECVLHVFVVDKILGWKTRPVRTLEVEKAVGPPVGSASAPASTSGDSGNLTVAAGAGAGAGADADAGTAEPSVEEKPDTTITPEKATKWSATTIAETISDPKARMEVSRINPAQCPEVLKIAAVKKNEKACRNGNTPPFRYVARRSKTEREEVVLVKWRGRSYLHCSWERISDLEAMDPTKTTAKTKIRKYMQSLEVSSGWNWKANLEKERRVFHEHGHGSHAREIEREDKYAPTEEEEFFPTDFVEIERILACDESEMNMDIFPKQRALNALAAERDALEAEKSDDGKSEGGRSGATTPVPGFAAQSPDKDRTKGTRDEGGEDGNQSDDSWDPEDYVRYVVKFKGLPLSDLSWEYWLHIKCDGVEQAEDFWFRQQPPKKITEMKHPLLRDFKKLRESPVFGISSRKKTIAQLDGNGKPNGRLYEVDDGSTENALKLRSYQLEGVNWLLWNWFNKRSCILADEMGLGKTIQSMTFLDRLMHMSKTQVRGPFLIVAPLSLVAQWQSEAATWAPDMNVILYHGSADARDFLVKQEFYYTDQFVPKADASKLKRQNVTKCHVVVTTYEVAMKDVAVLSRVKWKALIVDEAHRLKNATSRLFRDLGGVPRDFCLLLTGTPLQNSTEELWALLNFADPVNFASKEAFTTQFGQLTSQEQVANLHKVLKPYLLRRVKEDVEKALPPKEETILEVTLTPIQKTYYKAIYEKNTTFLFKGAKSKNAPSLMNAAMELRKVCNHPFLIGGAEERILADASAIAAKEREEASADSSTSTAAQPPISPKKSWKQLTGEQLIKSSGKMVLLDKLLPKLRSGGHKVLIFSQMVRVLDLLEDLLRIREYKFERLDGSRSASLRSAAVDRFNRPSFDRFVMLLSTRAGGLGLNLVSADTVIIFDSDWNPQNDLQAMARAHRIGQTRAVSVYRLLTSKTYEMHMFNSASMKLGLDRAVLAQQRATDEKGRSKRSSKEQAQEIDTLLKKGAYDVFRDDDDEEAKMFMEETDIDKLLERSAKKITYGTENSSLSSGLGSFSKASFVASGEGDGKDVDLDDPNFWEKAVGLQAPPDPADDELVQLMTDGKRHRKQVQQYDPYAVDKEAEMKKQEKLAELEREEEEEKEIRRLTKYLERWEREGRRAKRKREKEEEKEKAALEARERKSMKKKKKKKQKTEGQSGSHLSSRNTSSGGAEQMAKVEVLFPPRNTKKARKEERKMALRRAEMEDPVIERIRQAWEVPQRNRATSAALRFGFSRFSKIRHESALTSLPLQDIEVFVRAFLYQLGLQAAISLTGGSLTSLGSNLQSMVDFVSNNYGETDGDWMINAMKSSLMMMEDVEGRSRFLRMPVVLAEPEYVAVLRAGPAIRALRRFAFLSRVNAIVGAALDTALSDLGSEELGRRGCHIQDVSTLDLDLKARFVSTEELTLAIGSYLSCAPLSKPRCFVQPAVAPWWDRSCDVALIIGTFIHGLGNYEAMRNDEELPFARRIRSFISYDPGSALAHICFHQATKTVKSVYVDALKTSKRKQQIESHEAVAAVIAAAGKEKTKPKKAEDSTKIKTTSGADDGSSGKPKPTKEGAPTAADGTQEKSSIGDTEVKLKESTSSNKVKAKNDLDTITLRRLSSSIIRSIEDKASAIHARKLPSGSVNPADVIFALDKKTRGCQEHCCFPMPDAVVLDTYLRYLVDSIDGSSSESSPTADEMQSVSTPGTLTSDSSNKKEMIEADAAPWRCHLCDRENTHEKKRCSACRSWKGGKRETPKDKEESLVAKAAAPLISANAEVVAASIGNGITRTIATSFRGSLCGSQHKSLIDHSDYGLGAASSDLASLATGADSARYLRGPCVPLYLTRFGISALAHADPSVVDASCKAKMEEQRRAKEKLAAKKKKAPAPSEKQKAEDSPAKPSPNEASNEESGAKVQDSAKDSSPTSNGKATADETIPPTNAAPSNTTSASKSESKDEEASSTKTDAATVARETEEKEKQDSCAYPIPPSLADDTRGRAGLCIALLTCGLPHPVNGASKQVSQDFYNAIIKSVTTVPMEQDGGPSARAIYNINSFIGQASKHAGSEDSTHLNLKEADSFQKYFDEALLPHCLRLCVEGESILSSKDVLRFDDGRVRRSPIPDPRLPLKMHAEVSIRHASTILRRVRLVRSVQHVAGGGVPIDQVLSTLSGPLLRACMDGLPLWWCPWIHDLGLLFHVAAHGLASITMEKEIERLRQTPCFEIGSLQKHIRSVFVDGKDGKPPSLPAQLLEASSSQDINEWIRLQASQMPSGKTLERRLAMVCGEISRKIPVPPNNSDDDEPADTYRYHHIPMFDLGGWPIDE